MMNSRLQKLLEMESQKPGDAFLKFAIAQEYVGMNDDKTALACFRFILQNQPAYLPLYYQLGKLYERGEDLVKAAEVYAQGIIVAKAAHDFKTAGELNEALILLDDE